MLIRNSGDMVRQAVLIAFCGVLALTGWDTHDVRANLALPVSLLIMLGYCLLSVTWAIDPGISIRRLGLTAITMWFMCRSARLLGYGYTIESLRIALVILLVLNFATVFLSRHGIHGSSLDTEESVLGAWRGILDHKNIAGPITAITIMLFLFDPRGLEPFVRFAVVVLAAVFLWFTQSKTSISAWASRWRRAHCCPGLPNWGDRSGWSH